MSAIVAPLEAKTMNRYIASAAYSALSLVAISAGALKLTARDAFGVTVRQLLGVSAASGSAAATLTPIVEIAVGVYALLSPGGTIPAIALVCFFVILVPINLFGWKYGRGRKCQCFGALSQGRFGPRSLFRSVALAVTAMYVFSASKGLAGTVGPGSRLVLSACGAAVIILLLKASNVLALSREER